MVGEGKEGSLARFVGLVEIDLKFAWGSILIEFFRRSMYSPGPGLFFVPGFLVSSDLSSSVPNAAARGFANDFFSCGGLSKVAA